MNRCPLLLGLLLLPPLAAQGQGFAAFRTAIAAGGGTSAGGAWQTSGAVGQGDAGSLAAAPDGGFAGAGGFWSALLANSNPNRLGASSLLEGPSAGSDSVTLLLSPFVPGWTASVGANSAWLHLPSGSLAGNTSTNVTFTFDVNSGAPRTGTLLVAGRPLSVTQAGANYVAAGAVTLVGSGLNYPQGLAADPSGNIYIADTDNNAVKLWSPLDGSLTTLPANGLAGPSGVAVDPWGNVDIADTGNNALKQWSPVTAAVSTLFTYGLLSPEGVAVDAGGNVFVADTYHSDIRVWQPLGGTVQTLPLSGLSLPYGVAVDFAGNFYLADTGNSLIRKGPPGGTSAPGLPITGLSYPFALAVDGGGALYFADTYNNDIKRWSPANGQSTTLLGMGLAYPAGVAVDQAGNVYATDTLDNRLVALPRAFVNPTPRSEPAGAGVDALPAVVPANANLVQAFAPASDQPWLTITAVTNGIVNFALAANTAHASRLAHITLLGQSIPVTQAAPPGATGLAVIQMGSLQIADGQLPGDGHFQFNFTGPPGGSYVVWSTVDLNAPLSQWTLVGNPVETAPGTFRFTSPTPAQAAQTFYRLQAR